MPVCCAKKCDFFKKCGFNNLFQGILLSRKHIYFFPNLEILLQPVVVQLRGRPRAVHRPGPPEAVTRTPEEPVPAGLGRGRELELLLLLLLLKGNKSAHKFIFALMCFQFFDALPFPRIQKVLWS